MSRPPVQAVRDLEPHVALNAWRDTGSSARRPLGDSGWWSTTLAWGRRTAEHGEALDAVALESAVGLKNWTLLGRGEWIETNELLGNDGHHFQRTARE